MSALAFGFVWTPLATVVAVVCAAAVGACVALFLRFGKRPAEQREPGDLLAYFSEVPVAVMGSHLRGFQKEVGAHEYLATLLALEHRGLLQRENSADASRAALRFTSAQVQEGKPPLLALDAATLALLRHFSENGEAVYLRSAQAQGEAHAGEIAESYGAWKALVKAEAKERISVSSQAARAQRAVLFCGYVLVVLAAISAYIFTLMASTIFLVGAAVVLILSQLMQQSLFAERNRVRKLYQWLDSLDTHLSELVWEKKLVQQMLEYAVLFGIAEKTGKTIQSAQIAPEIGREIEALSFWKQLRDALYASV